LALIKIYGGRRRLCERASARSFASYAKPQTDDEIIYESMEPLARLQTESALARRHEMDMGRVRARAAEIETDVQFFALRRGDLFPRAATLSEGG